MTLEFGLWRVTDGRPQRLQASGVPLEKQLEDYIEADPSLLGERLMLIGRQVPTGYGFVDLMAVDSEGDLHVLELKKDMTPREVVAQVIDYGAWASSLDHSAVKGIFEEFRSNVAFEAAFSEFFGGDAPEELNSNHHLTIVAGRVDASTERIVQYLNESWGLPINVVMFRYFSDGDRAYLARTWLVEEETTSPAAAAKGKRTKEPWNGQDWYVSFGTGSGRRDWEDAREYGFVSAGGGSWYSQTLKSLMPGAHVYVNIPQTGYVGHGTVAGEAQRFDEAVLRVAGVDRPMHDLPLKASYGDGAEGAQLDDATAEWIVPVEWRETRPVDEAIWKPGMFANQNSACKLRQKFTLSVLREAFGLEASGSQEASADLGQGATKHLGQEQ
jgi:hypothetical protein